MPGINSSFYEKYIKKLMDIFAASFMLIITLPITIIVSILIKLESPGPVIFTQKRTGYGGKDFNIYKFRTMTQGNDVLDFSKKNEMTRIGRIIRALSIDELPQLINIIKGEMSFIGPRPWIVEYYQNMNQRQRMRVSVLPGLTGLAQVNGRNSLTIHHKIDYDLVYVQKISLLYDIKIFFETIRAVFNRGGQLMEKSGIKEEIEALKQQKNYDHESDIDDIVGGGHFKESTIS